MLKLFSDPSRGQHIAPPVTTLSIMPPGKFRIWIPGVGWSSILSGRSGAEIAFVVCEGAFWIRRAGGTLEEIKTEPFDYFRDFGLHGPYELQTPKPID